MLVMLVELASHHSSDLLLEEVKIHRR